MKIKLIALALILIASTTLAVSVNKIFQDDIQTMCENDSSGQLICLTGSNYEYNIPVIYTDNIECLENSSTFNPENTISCYSKIKFTKIQKFKLNYNREATPDERAKTYSELTEITKTKTYFPNEEITAIINPELIDSSKCKLEENISMPPDYYYYLCNYKGEKQVATFLVTEKAMIITDAKQGFSFNLTMEDWIYIILGLIIIGIIYSMVKKPEHKKKNKKEIKKSKRSVFK